MMLHTPLYAPNDDSEGTVLGQFITSLDKQIEDLKNSSIEGSVDAVIVGGLIDTKYGDLDKDNYTRTKDFISSRVGRHLKDLPVTVAGPKIKRDSIDNLEGVGSQADAIYFENKTRRLFLLRPEYTKER